MSALSSVFCRFFILFSLLFTAVTLQATELDAALESALDRYILLIQTDEAAADQLLQQLAQNDINTPALRSRVRLARMSSTSSASAVPLSRITLRPTRSSA